MHARRSAPPMRNGSRMRRPCGAAAASRLPGQCDAAFAILAGKGGLPPELRWQRIEKAAGEWQPAVMRSAARGLPADELALANDYAAFFDAVHERALTWPKTARSRWIASQGLARLAKSVPQLVDTQLPKYANALGFSEADRGRVLYQAALCTVASYEPDSAQRLNAVPESAYDENCTNGACAKRCRVPTGARRWRRWQDWRQAAQGSRWTYFEAAARRTDRR